LVEVAYQEAINMDKIEGNDETRKAPQPFGFSYVNLADGKPAQIKYNGLPGGNPIQMFFAIDEIVRDIKMSYYQDFVDKLMKKHNLESPQQDGVVEPPVGEDVIDNGTSTEEHIEGND
jgi:hypothetical protein